MGTRRFEMASAIGLRHPASASCLGRHLRLAGRCPNNSSLFPPLAAVVVVALWPYSAEKIFYNFGIPERLRTLRYSIFTGRVRWRVPSPSSLRDATSPKGRGKSAAGNFLIAPNALVTNLRAWLPLRGSWHRAAMPERVIPPPQRNWKKDVKKVLTRAPVCGIILERQALRQKNDF